MGAKNLFINLVVESKIRVIKEKFSTINNFIKRNITIIMYIMTSTRRKIDNKPQYLDISR